MRFFSTLLLALSLAAVAYAGRCPHYEVRTLTARARHPAGLQRKVDRFRRILGGEDHGSERGPFADGQRSINWDADAVPFDMPGDFFRNTVTRGLELFTPRHEFRVSNPPDNSDDQFDSINHNVADDFQTFSPPRLFTPLFHNFATARFSVPGPHGAPAEVSGFGAIFTDVDRAHTTSITYTDRNGCLIGKVNIPPRSRGLSFGALKVLRRDGHRVRAAIYEVKLQFGNEAIVNQHGDEGHGDIVVADDFFYGEPQATN